jgi:hypothetical protein
MERGSMMTEARRFDYTRDALRDLGKHGNLGDLGYSWCEREGAYHLAPMGETRTPNANGKVRLRFPTRGIVSLALCSRCGTHRREHASDGTREGCYGGFLAERATRAGTCRTVRVAPNARAIAKYLARRVA